MNTIFVQEHRNRRGVGRGGGHEGQARDITVKEHDTVLLAGQFAVETTQSHGEGLHGAHWVAEIHGEHVFSYPTELHNDVFVYKEKMINEMTEMQTTRNPTI